MPLRRVSCSLICLCLALFLGPCLPAFGDGSTDWVPPADWPAGARVNTFLQAYLENCILAPLDSPAAPPRVALSALGIDFAAHLQAADLPEERVLYNDAVGLCDLLGRLLDERDTAQAALFNAQTGGHATNPLDAPAYATGGHYSWNLERERRRAQHHQEIQARLNVLDKKSLFVSSQLQNWAARTVRFRQVVQAAAINVNAAQIRFDRAQKAVFPPPVQAPVSNAAPAAPTLSPVAAAAPIPPVPAAPLPNGPDPVIGEWMLDGQSRMTLEKTPRSAATGQEAGTTPAPPTTDETTSCTGRTKSGWII